MWCIAMTLLVGFSNGLKLTDPINTPNGQIRGMFAEDGTYSMFFGIPFAQIDVKNPFGISTPHPGFNGVFHAINDTIIKCPQLLDGGTNSLDCLHLNIYVPNNADSKMAVLVWIYGGAFESGYARLYDDERFIVHHKVIFVSFNYRVGPYGFMCLDTEEVPGNQGLRDQYLAFTWIKENIAAFGGDVNRITVMGESSGAISLDLHLLSELPILFNRAIIQSGASYTPQTVTPSNKTVPISMAKHLGFNTDNITEAVLFLATASTESVLATYEELNIFLRPCVEKKFSNITRFISSHPEYNSNSIPLKNISILAGFSNREGIFQQIFFGAHAELYEQSQNEIFQICINLQFDTAEMSTMVDRVRRFYVGEQKVKLVDGDEITDFFSDFFFIFPMQRSIIRYAEAGARVYQYLFSYDGDRNYLKRRLKVERDGAAHGDDLGYLFNISFFSERPTVTDQLIIDRMTTMWTNFAKYGNPTPKTSELLPVIWPRVTIDEAWHLNIDTNLTVGTRPYHKRMLFWDLFLDANRDKLRGSPSLQNVSSAPVRYFSPQ